jgi:hypothetical protein
VKRTCKERINIESKIRVPVRICPYDLMRRKVDKRGCSENENEFCFYINDNGTVYLRNVKLKF